MRLLSVLLLALAGAADAASWDEFKAERADARFTEWLRAEAGDRWTSAVQHSFTVELAQGKLDPAVMRRYLIQDHRFLDSFIVLLSSTVAAVPTLADRVPGARFLGLIAGEENTYFERSLQALGAGDANRRAAVPSAEVTKNFDALMRSSARSGRAERMLAVLCVCEWVYMEWGEREQERRAPDLPFWAGEWIDLHSGPHFRAVVDYLRGLLDRLGPEDPSGVREIFLQAVEYENMFWKMALEETHLDVRAGDEL